MTSWNGQLLRLSLFSPSFDPVAPSTLWQDVVGAEPEQDEVRPRERVRRQFGNLDETFGLELQILADRLIWFIGPRIVEEGPPQLDFGPADTGLSKFSDLFRPWLLKLTRPFSRVGIGSILLLPVNDRQAGYAKILELAPSLRFDVKDDVSDLLFQINRPKASLVDPDIRLNRLMKFSVSVVQNLAFAISTGGDSKTIPSAPARHFCRVELDINTSPDPVNPTSVAPSKNVPLFDELLGITREIAAKGEMAQ